MAQRSKINLSTDELHNLSFDAFDEAINPRSDWHDFDAVVEDAISRRGFLGGVIAMGSVAGLSAATTALTPVSVHAATSRFGFEAVSISTKDTVVVPKGYNWHVATRWGDPLFSDIPEFDHATRGTAASQAGAFGDNNDGMAIFTDQDGHQILIANNEYTNRSVMWGNNPDGKYATDDDINKGKNAHGLTAVELKEIDGRWQIVKDSPYNRRFTPDEPMEITGPARGHALMKTNADPQGFTVLGTFNNCGNGRTPWGTYLACEENFNGYFGTADQIVLRKMRRKNAMVSVAKIVGMDGGKLIHALTFLKNRMKRTAMVILPRLILMIRALSPKSVRRWAALSMRMRKWS